MATPNLPFLPGLSPSSLPQNGAVPRRFDFKNGYAVHKDGDVPLPARPPAAPRVEKATVAMSSPPDWLKYDRFVLRFYGSTKEAVHERQYQGALDERSRVRKVTILYYVASKETQINAAKEANSGIVGGVMLGKSVVEGPDGIVLGPKSFVVGSDIVIHGRTYTIHDADVQTREFLREQYGVQLDLPTPVPEDAWHMQMREERARSTACTPKSDVTKYAEVVHGSIPRQTLEDSRQWTAGTDAAGIGQVLRYWCRGVGAGFNDDEEFILHYYLADNSVEVRHYNLKDGDDNFPCLLKRQKLSKSLPKLGVDNIGDSQETLTARELRCGETVTVLGRELLLERADGFTMEWCKRELGMKDSDFPVLDPTQKASIKYADRKRSVPVIGDSNQPQGSMNWKKIPILKQRELAAGRRKWGLQAVRWLAKLAKPSQADAVRRFVIYFYLADSSIAVYENAVRNSGFPSGKFLEKVRIKNRVTNDYFALEDFEVGCNVVINGFQFELLRADSTNETVLTGEKESLGASTVNLILRDMGQNAHFHRFNNTETFRKIDEDGDARISKEEFRRWLRRHGYVLTQGKLDLLFDSFDNGDGYISLPEFMGRIEEEALLSPRGYN